MKIFIYSQDVKKKTFVYDFYKKKFKNFKKKIYLTIDGDITNFCIGFFGRIGINGEVKNLGIIDCDVIGGDYVGGLCGLNYGENLTSCYSTGSIDGFWWGGGLCGANYYGTISSCYSTCSVDGTRKVGGLCGSNVGGTITSCYSTGLVDGTYDVGGFCGENSGTISSCFWDTNTSGLSTSDGGVAKTTAQMQIESTFTNAGWNFVDIWAMSGYPALIWSIPYNGGSGTEVDPYLIFTKADLLELGESTNDYDKCFKMTAGIDLDGEAFTRAVIAPDTDQSSSGFQGVAFSGVFDGNSNSVQNLTIDGGTTNDYIGLFGCSEDVLRNILIESCSIGGSENVAGLVGWNVGVIESVAVTGVIEGNYKIGMLAGESDGVITECGAGGYVANNDGTYVGGLVGYDTGIISNCYSKVDVFGYEAVGGLVGWKHSGSVVSSYACGQVSGIEDPGGLIGFGRAYYSTVDSSFWDVDTSEHSTSFDGGVGQTTAQMQTKSTFTDAGWDFDNVWIMNGYPELLRLLTPFDIYLIDREVPVGEQGYADCPSGDDIQNLLKYAIGLDPMEICSTADLMEPITNDVDGVSIIYNKSKDAVGVQLFPMWSESLLPADWDEDGFDFYLMSNTDSNATWKATHSMTGECGYIRLKAQED
jgi:hypothetical protein